MYIFSVLNQSFLPCMVLIVASWPVQRFLKRQVMWSGIPISVRIFQFLVIHAVKSFSIVKKAKVDVFQEFSCFSHDPTDVGNFVSGSSAFSKSSLNIWKFSVTYYWSLSWRILSITSLACEMSTIVRWFEHSLVLTFFGTESKTDL